MPDPSASPDRDAASAATPCPDSSELARLQARFAAGLLTAGTVPATFIIDRSGVIRAAFVDVDYRKRAEPSVIVSALRQLPAE